MCDSHATPDPVPPVGHLDVDTLRAATPGVEHRVHLNNAGAALPTRATLDTVVDHLRLEADTGGYEAAAARAQELERCHVSVARLLGVDPSEVALTTSDTAAWTKAFWGFVLGGGLDVKRRVVVDRAVYNSHHLAVLQAVRHLDIEVEVVGPAADGTAIDLHTLARLLDGTVGLVSATHVPTHSGAIAPVAEVGELARRAGVPFFLDACQSVGQLAVDLPTIGCDVATITGRKWLRAPRGTGVLVVRSDVVDRFDPPGIDSTSANWSEHGDAYTLAPDARRFEEFEVPVAARLGLGTAVDELLDLGVDAVQARIDELAEHLRTRLDATPGLRCTDPGPHQSGIVTFGVEGRAADDVAAQLALEGINVSVSRAANSRLDFDARGLDTVVRASPHVYNTTSELDRLVEVVAG